MEGERRGEANVEKFDVEKMAVVDLHLVQMPVHLGPGWEIHLSCELVGRSERLTAEVHQDLAAVGKLAKNYFFGGEAGRFVVGRPLRLRPTFAVTSSFGFEAWFGQLKKNEMLSFITE